LYFAKYKEKWERVANKHDNETDNEWRATRCNLKTGNLENMIV
jgi:hypothetical protein